jgi:threonyl-tRNA synthetase
LPVRLAEFGTVYRYEQSGELNGMTRVRGFTQDDSHIYCTPDQLKDEIKHVIELTQLVFNKFGMEVTTRLSFRDESSDKFGGNPEQWAKAEREIKEVADEIKLNYFIGKGEAAFYGPKIDFMVKDALGRKWQLGTVQVDYVMPERFQLEFIGSDNGKHRPVIIHRAPFGSMERFVAILTEHYAGAFPFWLAPVQIKFLPISDKFNDYVVKQIKEFQEMGFRVEADLRNEKIGKKIRDAQGQKVPYMIVLGEKEVESGTYAVRDRVKGDLGSLSKEDLLKQLNQENR